MKGDAKVIEFLNKALYNELTAINQYFLHAKMLKNWGLKELAEHEYHESIDEMKHADKLSDRILFLDGLPNFQALGKLKIGENPRELLQCDLALELEALPVLKDGIAHCEQVRDFASRELALPENHSYRTYANLDPICFTHIPVVDVHLNTKTNSSTCSNIWLNINCYCRCS